MSSFEFTKDGHHYKVVPIENSNEYSVIKDNRFSRTAGPSLFKRHYDEAGHLIAESFIESEIIALFDKEVRHG